jgi:Fic family protein
VLREPLLYSSLYLKRHRQQYYAELNAVRESGDFERWLEFFATAIRVSAEQATMTGQGIFTVFREDRIQLRALGRQAPAALLIQEALRALEQLNIVRETTGRARGRIFSYVRYLDALNSEVVAPAQI